MFSKLELRCVVVVVVVVEVLVAKVVVVVVEVMIVVAEVTVVAMIPGATAGSGVVGVLMRGSRSW